MKALKFNTKTIFSAVFVLFSMLYIGCSDNENLFGPSNESADMPPAPRITVEPRWEGGLLVFKVINNTTDTIINDFHVQFDTNVRITGWITMVGWQIDAPTTDTAHGKIGVKKMPQGQPILPGQAGQPVAVQLRHRVKIKKPADQWWDFTWQATRDGIVVASGRGEYPR